MPSPLLWRDASFWEACVVSAHNAKGFYEDRGFPRRGL